MSNLRDDVKEVLDSAPNSFLITIMDDEVMYSPAHKIHYSQFNQKGISVNRVDSYGGEGCGEEYWSVYKFSRDQEVVYVKFEGYYTSYDGSTYQGFIFVEPREVMVTQYFEVK
jgi:hypothetical protein